MSKISIPRKTYEIDFDGVIVKVRRPTIAQQDEYIERYSAARVSKHSEGEGETKEEVMYWLLKEVGFDVEFLKTLDVDQFAEVVELITVGETKKK